MGSSKKKISKFPTVVAGHNLDSSMDSMEETRFRKRYRKLTISLAEKLHFDYNEVELLLIMYYKFQKVSKDSKHGMEKTHFRDMLHCSLDMTDDYLMDRIFYNIDKGSSTFMTMETWVTTLSLFLKGTLEEKMNYCYMVYDALGDKLIGREAMFHLLSKSFLSLTSEEDAEETAKELIEMLTKKIDFDRDGKISLNDYKQAVMKQPMLLEVFGQCLPSRENAYAFMTTFANKPGKM